MRLRSQVYLKYSLLFYFLLATLSLLATSAAAQSNGKSRPWMNTSLSPDERASMVVKEMTLDEKISMLHGTGMAGLSPLSPQIVHSNGGAGFVPAIPRLGIPAIQESDSAYGVRASGENGRYSTALTSCIGGAATWDLQGGFEYGALIGRELRAQGFNMSLGGGVNLTREPRNGRTFEYMGEDPILAGKMVASVIRGIQSEHAIGDIKHYALNDQESGRNAVNITIDERAARESDLLAFEIGIKESDPGAVMCSYNRLDGIYACENKFLLTDVLKKDWNYKGFVISDWGAAHSTVKSSHAGLDQEQPGWIFYGDDLKKAVQNGSVSQAELDDHVHRILRAMFATGVVDDPGEKSVVDIQRGFDVSQKIEESAIVLLKNEGQQLPLDASKLHSIAIIGPHADVGMISGGGSAQVDPPGGNAIMPPGKGQTHWLEPIWFPTSPLKSVRERAPGATVTFASGADVAAAAELAKKSDVVLVFAYQWESEGMDLPSLSLPENQDELIAKVASANPHTVVVVESGGPVTMPWAGQVSAILEAWYAGSKGSDAVANVLFGSVNPSGKLPVTFPNSIEDLPHPKVVEPPPASIPGPSNEPWIQIAAGLAPFPVTYNEGVKVGYKWYDAENKPVLFPFGHGLSYTTYSYSNLRVTTGKTPRVTFTLTNSGSRAGAEVAEVYASLPTSAGEPPKRLVGWSKVQLNPGESKEVTVDVDPWYLSIWDVKSHGWKLIPGDYNILVGGSSQTLPLKQSVSLN